MSVFDLFGLLGITSASLIHEGMKKNDIISNNYLAEKEAKENNTRFYWKIDHKIYVLWDSVFNFRVDYEQDGAYKIYYKYGDRNFIVYDERTDIDYANCLKAKQYGLKYYCTKKPYVFIGLNNKIRQYEYYIKPIDVDNININNNIFYIKLLTSDDKKKLFKIYRRDLKYDNENCKYFWDGQYEIDKNVGIKILLNTYGDFHDHLDNLFYIDDIKNYVINVIMNNQYKSDSFIWKEGKYIKLYYPYGGGHLNYYEYLKWLTKKHLIERINKYKQYNYINDSIKTELVDDVKYLDFLINNFKTELRLILNDCSYYTFNNTKYVCELLREINISLINAQENIQLLINNNIYDCHILTAIINELEKYLDIVIEC